MHIQWFPGHMTSALRMMEENIKLVDAVIYVLDARAPIASQNPYLDQVAKNKPKLILLNKADMADAKATSLWQKHLSQQGNIAVETNAIDKSILKIITSRLNIMLKAKLDNLAAKGVKKPLRAMIVGIPNCGKSTILNTLAGSKKANVGDKPGVTRAKQWVRLSQGFELLDTPGTLWNSFEDQSLAMHLAFIGSISDDVLDFTDLAVAFIEELRAEHSQNFIDRYKIEMIGTSLQIFESICKARGFIKSGGELDYERAGRAIIDDYRKVKLGRITLEKC